MKTCRPAFFLSWAVLLFGSAVHAQELLPADRAMPDVIDHYIQTNWKQVGVTPARQLEETQLIRRLTLDLVGRIPTVAEVQAFVASTDPKKREKLVDRLLASPGFARYQASEFDVMLMGTSPNRRSVQEYLTRALSENRSWDRIFRELMLPDENNPAQKGASAFLLQRTNDLDRMTSEVSVAFFGVNVSCAQCHDHPKVEEWTQDHFYGMKAFFNRTVDVGGNLAERSGGEVRYKTTKGQERLARMMFLTSTVVDHPDASRPQTRDEQKKERELFESLKKKKQTPPAPAFSARAKLVELALQPGQNDFFARSIVNRMWHRLYGFGLVDPLDQMHAANEPSHPELLSWLARDLIQHRYDLRRLVRGLVLSQTYSLSTLHDQAESLSPNRFAFGRVRPLTPMQLATSLGVATANPLSWSTGSPAEIEKRLEQLENSARGFARELDYPAEDFQVSVSEALLFSNAERVNRDFLAEGNDCLVGRLREKKQIHEIVDTAVWATLSRPPSADEKRQLADYLSRRSDRPVEACKQLVWALLTSSEFRFNH